ncbi:MAG: hypothetical protein P8Y97_15765 [Candidatus Lokiarchaeota archaeon]
MCLECKGRGYTSHFTEDLIVRNPQKTLIEITEDGSGCFADQLRFVEQLPSFYNFDIKTSYKDLPEDVKHIFLYGSAKKLKFQWESKTFSGELARQYEGIIPHLERAIKTTTSTYRRKKIEKNYMEKRRCSECNGYKINQQAREVKIAGRHIGELGEMTINNLITFIKNLESSSLKTSQGKALINTILESLQNMINVGLSYVQLNRELPTLSGGELQRLSLMNNIDAGF